MKSNFSLIEFARDYGLRLVILVGVVVTFVSISPGFRSVGSIYAILEQLAFVGIVAMGLAVTMIAGELDLSVASMAAVMGVIAIHAAQYGLIVAILAATAGGVILGGLQGWAIARLGINSLVFTTGTLILLRGLAYIFAENEPVVLQDFATSDALHQRLGIFSPASILAIVVVGGVGAFLAFTRPGRNIYAIGGARTEAIAAGAPVRKSLTTAFAFSGGAAGLAGGIACLKGGSAAPEGFPDLLLLAVGAALIGGIGLYGGVGNLWHVLIGVGIVGSLSVGMSTLAGPSYLNNLVLGSLLIVLLLADFALDRAATRERLARLRRKLTSGPDAGVRATASGGAIA
jgi:ribose transport system permease protein